MISTPLNADLITALRQRSALTAVVAGAVAVGLGLWRPQAFWPVYLVAVTFVLGIGLGCLAVALLHRLTGGRWGTSVLRELTAAVGTLPIMSLLLLPLLIGAAHCIPGWSLRDRRRSSTNINRAISRRRSGSGGACCM